MTVRLAILGATGHIGKGLSAEFVHHSDMHLILYARDLPALEAHLAKLGDNAANVDVLDIADFGKAPCDVVVNAIGAGDPARLAALAQGIFRLTETFDNLVLDYLQANPETLYLNLSSGAAYGSGFSIPVGLETEFSINVNDIKASQHYGMAKLYAEVKHRAHENLNIVDLRVFSYFSRFIDLSGRFFMADLTRCLINGETLVTDGSDLLRDYIVPADLAAMIHRCIERWTIRDSRPLNSALDCYSGAPVGKFELIDAVHDAFKLRSRVDTSADTLTTTGPKNQYFSTYHLAADWGYKPIYTSKQGVLNELHAML
jgi:nucleoside-diphosphate-sugar epimerase